MENKIGKTVNLELVDNNENAFAILGAFSKQARREGWTQEEIDLVLDEAKSDDYDHLLVTIMTYCEPHDESDPDNEK